MKRRDPSAKPLSRRATLLVVGGAAVGATGCQRRGIYRARAVDGVVRVPATHLTGLRGAGDVLVVRAEGRGAIMMRRVKGELIAVWGACTHARCVVDVQPHGYACACHGSEFDEAGQVQAGPAKDPLVRVPLQMTGQDALLSVGTSG